MNIVQEEFLRDQKKVVAHTDVDTARRIIASKGLISLKVRNVAEAANARFGAFTMSSVTLTA